MEVTEVISDGIQQQYILFTPLKKPVLVGTVLYDPVEHLAHKHSHGVLVQTVANSKQRVFGNRVPHGVEIGL